MENSIKYDALDVIYALRQLEEKGLIEKVENDAGEFNSVRISNPEICEPV